MTERRAVLILGGGFGGLYAARALAARAAPGSLAITVVDRAPQFVFKPLLYELLTGEVAEADVAFPFADVLERPGIEHLRAEVREIDLERRRVRLAPADPRAPAVPEELAFDAAAVALGSEPDFRGLPGLAEHALAASSLGHFRRLDQHLAALAAGPDDAASRTVAVCGAGPSGVEIAGKLADRFAAAARRSGGGRTRIVVVEASPGILGGFSEEIKARGLALLEAKGVELRLGTAVRSADAEGLEVEGAVAGRERIPARTVIWTAGQRPSPVVRALPGEHSPSGRLVVPSTLELRGRPGVFALGDNARCVIEGAEAPPETAQVAVQQSSVIARNVLARLEGKTLSSFRYFPLAETLSVGRGYDIFSVLGLRLEGRSANLVRRLAYVARLPGWKQRAAVGARLGARLAGEALDALIGRISG
ncbi:MAG TPA: FAD-dependent oxidoreductase [Planctomycetota bacterium]|nr:FAD-dependent oxidoreductase [Planctomycetota bacterium]